MDTVGDHGVAVNPGSKLGSATSERASIRCSWDVDSRRPPQRRGDDTPAFTTIAGLRPIVLSSSIPSTIFATNKSISKHFAQDTLIDQPSFDISASLANHRRVTGPRGLLMTGNWGSVTANEPDNQPDDEGPDRQPKRHGQEKTAPKIEFISLVRRHLQSLRRESGRQHPRVVRRFPATTTTRHPAQSRQRPRTSKPTNLTHGGPEPMQKPSPGTSELEDGTNTRPS